jgi:hypothetical protein
VDAKEIIFVFAPAWIFRRKLFAARFSKTGFDHKEFVEKFTQRNLLTDLKLSIHGDLVRSRKLVVGCQVFVNREPARQQDAIEFASFAAEGEDCTNLSTATFDFCVYATRQVLPCGHIWGGGSTRDFDRYAIAHFQPFLFRRGPFA